MKKLLTCILSVFLSITLLFGGSVSVFAAEDIHIKRVSCTVYGDTATQRGFCWYTEVDTDSVLTVFDCDGQDITDTLQIAYNKESWNGNYMHKAIVSGLTPATAYTYTVGNGVYSKAGSFTTDDGDDHVDFIFYADPQASTAEDFEAAAKVINKANEIMPNADFSAVLGDFTNDCTNAEWDTYAEYFDDISLKTTLAPVNGNHDTDTNWFKHLFTLDESESVQTRTGVNYSFDYGNVHIAVVNTCDIISVSDAQLDWLRNDMNSTAADWKIVMMHKSPYTLGKDGKWPDALYLQETLAAVCDETNVDLVLSGHDHMYLRTKPLNNNQVVSQEKGTTYVLSGTVGTKRYEVRPFSIDRFMPKAFIDTCVVQKNGYGNYFDGQTFDNTDDGNIGGCFNTISVRGGNLVLNSYILSDENKTVKNIDTLEISKAQGENTPTYFGDNTTSTSKYLSKEISTFMRLARYAFTVWLPTFIKAIPDIIKTKMETGTF